jgi:membrane protein implicated in regulation of membrane protease activity
MTQQAAITVGTPILSAVAATRAGLLAGIHLALSLAVIITLASAVLVRRGLRARTEAAPPVRRAVVDATV